MTRLLLFVHIACLVLLAGCSSPEDEASELVERAWAARVAGDRDAFAKVVVGQDVAHIETSGAVLQLDGVGEPTRQALRKSLVVEVTGTRPAEEEVEVDARVTWWPPGSKTTATEKHTYRAVKTPDGWRLDLELETRAKLARALGDARQAIRSGNPELASRILAEIEEDDLRIPENTMIVAALDATRESVKNADVLAELRTLMEAHHETEDPAERANLVAKARKLGIEEYELPADIETLWEEAKKVDEDADAVGGISENLVVEAAGAKKGYGAEVVLSVTNNNPAAVGGLRFVIDLIDESGMRVHRLSHEWAGPLESGASTKTTASAPSVPPSWEGAVNVRLEAARVVAP